MREPLTQEQIEILRPAIATAVRRHLAPLLDSGMLTDTIMRVIVQEVIAEVQQRAGAL